MRQVSGTLAMARPGQGRAPLARPAPGPSRLAQATAPVLRFGRERPGLILSVIAILGTTGAVGWNALHQANRHPAPLFRPKMTSQAEPPRRPDTATLSAQIAAPTPVPVPRPDPTTVGSVPVSAPPPAPPRAAPAGSDPIGAMIRGGDGKERTAEVRPDGRVTAAQKALGKLGYGPLKADGLMGVGTRQALERFERDNNLPVTGGLGVKTVRQLASAAGTPID